MTLFFDAGACTGTAAVLTGNSGEFSSRGLYYEDKELCQWRIEVDIGKVNMSDCRLFSTGYQ